MKKEFFLFDGFKFNLYRHGDPSKPSTFLLIQRQTITNYIYSCSLALGDQYSLDSWGSLPVKEIPLDENSSKFLLPQPDLFFLWQNLRL